MPSLRVFLYLALLCLTPQAAWALPPAEDIPEEVLRSQIITGARSTIDGTSLTPAEHEAVQAYLQSLDQPQPQVSRKVRRIINLLKLRKFIKTVLPFIPLK